MSKFYDILQNHPGIFQAGDMGTLLNTGRRVPPSLCLCVWSVDKTVKLYHVCHVSPCECRVSARVWRLGYWWQGLGPDGRCQVYLLCQHWPAPRRVLQTTGCFYKLLPINLVWGPFKYSKSNFNPVHVFLHFKSFCLVVLKVIFASKLSELQQFENWAANYQGWKWGKLLRVEIRQKKLTNAINKI